jgi:hypothetical protein
MLMLRDLTIVFPKVYHVQSHNSRLRSDLTRYLIFKPLTFFIESIRLNVERVVIS